MEKYLVLATFVGSVIALLFALFTGKRVLSFEEGTPLMSKISRSIREGANAYLRRQYTVVGIFFACMIVVLVIMAACGLLTWFVPFAFLTGGFFSGLSGFVGMRIATKANCRTANACRDGLNKGLRVAFSAGSVMGFTVVGLGLFDISVWFMLLRFVFKLEAADITSAMLTFGMGASSMALFARVGGGIFTKAADVQRAGDGLFHHRAPQAHHIGVGGTVDGLFFCFLLCHRKRVPFLSIRGAFSIHLPFGRLFRGCIYRRAS